jgi:hypothetical protein
MTFLVVDDVDDRVVIVDDDDFGGGLLRMQIPAEPKAGGHTSMLYHDDCRKKSDAIGRCQGMPSGEMSGEEVSRECGPESSAGRHGGGVLCV